MSLTLEEKISLLTGRDFWTTQPVERLGIPAIWLADGPHGLRKAAGLEETGIGTSLPATCFPTAATLACSWDAALLERVGEAIGRECRHQGVHVLLGPGLNLKRHPLGGRNFEYYSEDPLLSGKLAAAFIRGVQRQGVAACPKHLAVNNQETDRMRIDARVEARPLHDLYLRNFEIAVREGRPLAIMTAYNQLNGRFCSENPWLLREVLRQRWGFRGIALSDWGAVNDRAAAALAGLNLEMPGNGGVSAAVLRQALEEGRISEAQLDELVDELLEVVRHVHEAARTPCVADYDAHHALAAEAAAASIVLLKNEGDLLPLTGVGSVAVIGAFAQKPRIQGGGSSHVVPTRISTLWDALGEQMPSARLTWAEGYPADGAIDETRINEAQRKARAAEVAVLCVGLPDSYESEGFDRTHLNLPPGHAALIRAVAAVQPRTVVVLTAGAPVAMPWRDEVPAIVLAGLPGQGGGVALARILTGAVSPSGKLAETWPARLEDTPAWLDWPGAQGVAPYGEGLFVGYRWYDTRRIEPLWPFGHGLAYTTFEYLGLEAGPTPYTADEPLELQVRIRNAGPRAGAEVVQLYVHGPATDERLPEQELAAFAKIALEAGEEGEVRLRVSPDAFSRWDRRRNERVPLGGTYELRVGASSRDIRLRTRIEVVAPQLPPVLDRFSPVRDWMQLPFGKQRLEPMVEALAREMAGPDAPPEGIAFMRTVLYDLPLHKLVGFTYGRFSHQMLEEMLARAGRTG